MDLIEVGVERIVVSIWGRTVAEYRRAAEMLSNCDPPRRGGRGQLELPEPRRRSAPVRSRRRPGGRGV